MKAGFFNKQSHITFRADSLSTDSFGGRLIKPDNVHPPHTANSVHQATICAGHHTCVTYHSPYQVWAVTK
jgi:hypothetical protein